MADTADSTPDVAAEEGAAESTAVEIEMTDTVTAEEGGEGSAVVEGSEESGESDGAAEGDGTEEGEVRAASGGEEAEEEEEDGGSVQDGAVAVIGGEAAADAARAAYAEGDADASRLLHDTKTNLAPEKHGGAGTDSIKSIVFGGLDGIITTFAIVSAVAGADLDIKVIILMGFANLIADALSMGVGDYLSSKAEMDMVLEERKREAWELKEYREGEIKEMIDLYVEKGFEQEDAETIIRTYTKKPEYDNAFIDHMMVVELGHMVPDPDDNPAKDGLYTFLSFIVFGSVPMWLYVIFYVAGYDAPEEAGIRFVVACIATIATLFSLGWTKAKITKANKLKAGLLMAANGTAAAASAYFIGWGLEEALGIEAGHGA